MAALDVAPAPQQQTQKPAHVPRRTRRPRRLRQNREPPASGPHMSESQEPDNGGGHVRPARDVLLALRPAAVSPHPHVHTHDYNHDHAHSRRTANLFELQSHDHPQGAANDIPFLNGPGRSRGRGGRNNLRRAQQSVIQMRQFGGQLTNCDSESNTFSLVSSSLQGDAPEFQPGQSAAPAENRSRVRQPQPNKRRMSRSTAPDIATRIHEDIDNRQYECPICTSEVLRHSKVWNCKMCWTVFHLKCITQWSANADSGTFPDAQTGEPPARRQWRCPGCNLPQDSKPTMNSYTCWCGKDQDPRSIIGLPPHSCGQTCGKARLLPEKCPHPCELVCHAGPCPPCTHVGPTQRCFCGKESTTRRCLDTQYGNGWSCSQACGDFMPCGLHNCPRDCHDGLCGACEVQVEARCYCGKEQKAIYCCDRDDEQMSTQILRGADNEQTEETWTGMFQCNSACERYFDCGKHQCQKPCHVQNGSVDHCPRSPDVVSHCACGKTNLAEISDRPRHSCDDPIPNCSRVCQKGLSCGHVCQQTCHTGECLPCLQKTTIHCRCGRTALSTICHQGTEEAPQCTRLCRTALNCGRHECGERCCAGEKKAAERQTLKRRLRPLGSATTRPIDDTFEAEHICTRPCGRLLKCGNHTCEELCHKGPCGSCREAIFDEIGCHCGRTVLQPPLPCGTKAPACRFNCERTKDCGHPQIPHNCHIDNDTCPKCRFLTDKPCLCGKKSLKNQQCWFTDGRCGEICGKRLKCGSHTCRKTCHRPGECEDAAGACQQSCGKPKKSCGHPDENICHAPFPCKEDKPCIHKLIITCDCQHKKQEIRCNASKTNEGNTRKSLTCDEECARLERNRKLAMALDIDPSTHTDDHIPYEQETITYFSEHSKWATEQEREFRVFASDVTEKRVRFKPMSAHQRAFLHSLAEDFGFDSESMDPEPHRHVAIFKTPRFVSAPSKTLRDCLRIRQSQRVAAAEAQAKAKSSVVSEPYNGFLLTSARFALTLDELSAEVAAVQGPAPKVSFKIQFLSNGDVALKALSQTAHTERSIDLALKELCMPVARAFNSHTFGTLQLCCFDDSLNVLRRELDSATEGGWSQVAAKAAAPRRAPVVQAVGMKSAFTVLGNLAGKKKKAEEERRRREESVVDDWEEAEVMEEEKEMRKRKEDDGGTATVVVEAFVDDASATVTTASVSVAPLDGAINGNVLSVEPALLDERDHGYGSSGVEGEHPIVVGDLHNTDATTLGMEE